MSGPLPHFLRELGFVLLQHRGHGQFSLLSPAPSWLVEIWDIPCAGHAEIPIAEKSPFLENFLLEADAFWNSNNKGFCRSETWVEKSPAGKEIPLEAIALQLEGVRFLALHSPEPEFQERVKLLQTARVSLLDQEKLQREIQKKEILLHCIIHDLSQPLSVMSVAFDCMTDERISDKGKGLLELGRRASDQQMLMIRDILQVFSADLKASLHPESKAESPDLLDCARSVLNAFGPVFAARNVELKLDDGIDAHAAWRVHGEATRIQRIFSNLLENALRYSPTGSTVTVRLAQDREFVRAFVDDEGPGLPPDMRSSRIFALFSKGKEGGGKAGLGLYFCRLTVERWGGTIGCESLPLRGSRFWFRLPKATGQAEPASQIAKEPARRLDVARSSVESMPAKKSPIRVLLAEDQEEIRMLTTLQLERRGHQVVSVANGQQALDALDRDPFDIILLDEDMPVMTGLEALRAIRAGHQKYGPMLLVAVTGYNSEPDQERLVGAGFDFVIGKPFRIDSLDAILRGTSAEPLSDTEKEMVSAPARQAPMANLLDRVGGDEQLARQMVATFLRDTPKRIEGIQKAVTGKNGEKLASFAHALKGSVSIFGAEVARDHSEKLQDLGRANDFRGAASLYKQLKEEIAELEANLRGYAVQNRSRNPGASPKTKRRTSNPKRKPR
jgi:signal transduction histidine kinase/HPt (histidine-containing phosphotransfer) domain-containing protein/ActR/RegA family two-component response regulator